MLEISPPNYSFSKSSASFGSPNAAILLSTFLQFEPPVVPDYSTVSGSLITPGIGILSSPSRCPSSGPISVSSSVPFFFFFLSPFFSSYFFKALFNFSFM